MKGCEAAVKLLLEKGSNLEHKDNYGRTSLSLTARNRHNAVVKLLLEEVINLVLKDGYSWPLLS